MNSTIATLILGALATISLASPIALEAKLNSINEAATANAYQKLVIEVSSQAAQEITYIQVCINGNLNGRCERLRKHKGELLFSRMFLFLSLPNNQTNQTNPSPPQSSTLPFPGSLQLWQIGANHTDSDQYYTGSSLGPLGNSIYNLYDYNFKDRASSYRCS
ncbi:MAG: hypothetical protein Q9221_007201 [Calogaya cf. arnoldii]